MSFTYDIDPGDELQVAIVSALENSADIIAFFAALDPPVDKPRVFDRVPAELATGRAAFPYFQVGDDQFLDDGNSCFEATEAIATVHVFSRAGGKREAKRLLKLARQALTALLEVEGQIVREEKFEDSRCYFEADGVTAHGVYNHRYFLEPEGA